MLINSIDVNKSIFELARELKYANKQIDGLRRELAELRNDYDEGLRAPDAASARRIQIGADDGKAEVT